MQSIREQLLSYAETKRDELMERANTGGDDDLPPEDRPNRAEVCTGCLLKFSDEVEVYGGTVLYLCPGRGYGWFYGISVDGATVPLGCYPAADVTDRIPADPNETPMPILPEQETPPEDA